MTQSPEYPDLLWIPPRAWESSNRKPKWIVVHTTQGAKNIRAAEDGAIYNQNRTDSTSCHYHADNDSVVQSVRTKDIAYCAFWDGNQNGIHYELCTNADTANWNDVYHTAMLDEAATQMARDCIKWGITARRLTVSQLQAKNLTGFCGHGDISNAFEGDHYDPGSNFPWTRFLNQVQSKINGEDDYVAAEQDMVTVSEDTNDALYGGKLPSGTKRSMANLMQLTGIWTKRSADNGAKVLEELKKTNSLLEQLVAQGKLPPKA